MTINLLRLQQAESIAYAEKFYPVEIDVPHPQLRNFISTVYENKLFYVNHYDVYTLDVQTRERSILVTIPFEARCLAAAHGWITVGGETSGDCAFIYIGEHDGKPGDFCHELLVVTHGQDIVNSTNIQILQPETDDYEEEIVVLISNNDRSVTMYSLSQRRTLTTIQHPKPINHAALSPDSTILAVVGDENKVYFRKRFFDEERSDVASETPRYASYDWRTLATPNVPNAEFVGDDYSFAVAFSANGQLCAVSSQGGMISIFDMHMISEESESPENAIICTWTASRCSLWGCIRSMAFAPGPWDLLAWTEDHGRIGLADLRQGCIRRQYLELTKDKVKEVIIEETTPPEWTTPDVKDRLNDQYRQRMQALRGHPPVGARVFTGASRNQVDTGYSVPDHINTLSDRERSIIRSLDTTVDEIASANAPYSIVYQTPSLQVESQSPSRTIGDYRFELLNPGSEFASYAPRRRSSVVLSESATAEGLRIIDSIRMTMTASPAPMADESDETRSVLPSTVQQTLLTADLLPYMSTNDLTPTAGSNTSQPMPYNIPPSDPWHVIEASLTDRNRQQASSGQADNLNQIERAIFAERQIANCLERQLTDEQRLLALLRSEHEARERSLGSRDPDAHTSRLIAAHPIPSLERLLQRQLHNECDHSQRRADELEEEVRNMSNRVNQLMDERELLLQRQRTLQARAQADQMTSTTTMHASAQSSALPTTLVRPDNGQLLQRLQTMDEDRRHRAVRIQDLQQQFRRAESRVELALLQNNAEQARPRTQVPATNDQEPFSPSASSLLPRFLQIPPPPPTQSVPQNNDEITRSIAMADARRVHNLFQPYNNISSSAITIPARTTNIIRPTTSGRNLDSPRAIAPELEVSDDVDSPARRHLRTTRASVFLSPSNDYLSFPGLPRVPSNDVRVARTIMFRAAAATSENRDWSPELQRTRVRSGLPGEVVGSTQLGLVEILRDAGVGTAGLGWSPDGTKLFAGTERGIFEFKLNIQDRLQCPAIELR